jgi:AcrR family transcriptional regulator
MAPRGNRQTLGESADAGARRRPGRPRNPDVDAIVLDAVADLLIEKGIEATTVSAAVRRSGVARATIYLRWPTRQALITAAIQRALGQPSVTSTNDLKADLSRASERLSRVFGSAAFRAVFPAVVDGLTRPRESTYAAVEYDTIAPGRDVLIRSYGENAAAQGFREAVPPELVADILIGAHVGYYLSNGAPPSPAIRDLILDIILEGLRRR